MTCKQPFSHSTLFSDMTFRQVISVNYFRQRHSLDHREFCVRGVHIYWECASLCTRFPSYVPYLRSWTLLHTRLYVKHVPWVSSSPTITFVTLLLIYIIYYIEGSLTKVRFAPWHWTKMNFLPWQTLRRTTWPNSIEEQTSEKAFCLFKRCWISIRFKSV